jgi:3-oxoacyl-[acyl-carrier protein] reductase
MSDDSPDKINDDAKVCLITGSSRGIGKCIALELFKQGNVKIVINDIEPMRDEAEKLVQEIRDAGGDAIAVTADCSKQEDIKAMFKEIMNHYGRCDVLVNNAGIARDNLMVRMKPEQWQQVIDINLTGVYYASQEFLKHAIKQHSGCIVNIASVVGQIGNPGQANYAAAKAGVIGLTKSNAKEFGSRGIRINAVCPGYIATPMTANLGDEFLNEMCSHIPLGRLGKPEEVAGVVRFLALDPAAEYMTGHCYDVDGGIAIGV